jgi:hypothetical protein
MVLLFLAKGALKIGEKRRVLLKEVERCIADVWREVTRAEPGGFKEGISETISVAPPRLLPRIASTHRSSPDRLTEKERKKGGPRSPITKREKRLHARKEKVNQNL